MSLSEQAHARAAQDLLDAWIRYAHRGSDVMRGIEAWDRLISQELLTGQAVSAVVKDSRLLRARPAEHDIDLVTKAAVGTKQVFGRDADGDRHWFRAAAAALGTDLLSLWCDTQPNISRVLKYAPLVDPTTSERLLQAAGTRSHLLQYVSASPNTKAAFRSALTKQHDIQEVAHKWTNQVMMAGFTDDWHHAPEDIASMELWAGLCSALHNEEFAEEIVAKNIDGLAAMYPEHILDALRFCGAATLGTTSGQTETMLASTYVRHMNGAASQLIDTTTGQDHRVMELLSMLAGPTIGIGAD